jgi:hypothetical protein
MRKTAKIILFMSALALAGCISGKKPPETYTDKEGNTTVIESDHEMCVRSCNEDYSRCMDTQSAQDNSGVNGPRGMFGASADCRRNLKDCLPGCQAQ